LALAACARPATAPAPDNDWAASGQAAVAQARTQVPPGTRARNVILFIGDGMGLSTVTAARILEGQRRGGHGEENRLAFEELPFLALAKTYCTNLQVADSACTATAMTTGVKTKAYAIGVDERVAPGDWSSVAASRRRTLFEEAEARGLATGIVTTTRITHATPAAAYGHSPHRDWEDDTTLPADAREAGFPDLARQLVEFPSVDQRASAAGQRASAVDQRAPAGDGIDVAFGGGRPQFLRRSQLDPERPELTGARSDGRDLIAAWQGRHPEGVFVWNRDQLRAIDPYDVGPVLGLFDSSHLAFEVDRARDVGGEPSLTEMTVKAIELLRRNPEGFVLMVEGGRIDQAHHLGNAYRALTDTIELSNAVRAALAMTDPRDTLVVVTADHSHVLTIAGYPHRGNDILGKVVALDEAGEPATRYLRDAIGRPFTTLSYANGPGYTGASPEQPEGAKRFPHLPTGYRGIARGRPDLTRVDTASPDYLQEATVPARNETHGGEDVPVYAGGPGAELFRGVQEQSYVFHAIVEALGWRPFPP
ncbi:MAG TPA: alkaline phosphatase, partial [Myxococcota bacterium]|nr:alkaline phosphatase [Myxococcota bacterium]